MRATALIALSVAWLLAVAGYLANDLLVLAAVVALLALTIGPLPAKAPARATHANGAARPTLASKPVGARAKAAGALAALCSLGAAGISLADPRAPAANYLWLASLALVVVTAFVHDGAALARLQARLTGLRRPAVFAEALAVVLVTLVAFALRAYNLSELPPIMHGDEGEMGVIVRDLLAGNAPPLFAASPFFSLPYVFNYLQAGSFLLFGQDEVGLRMLSALVGAACVPLIYAIGRMGWGRAAGFAAAWLMAVSHILIQYSRLGFVFIESVFGMLALMALLSYIRERSYERETLGVYALAGLALGLSQYFYFASRVMPLVAAPLLAHLWWTRRASWRELTVMVGATLVAFAPLGAYFAAHSDVFLDRVGFVSVLRDQNVAHVLGRNASLQADWYPLLLAQLERNLKLFVRAGDGGGFYFQNVAAFDALTSVLFWLGLGIALARARRYHDFALWTWFALGLFFGGILTIDAPSAQRLTVMLPTVCLFGALTISEVWRVIAGGYASFQVQRLRAAAAALICVVLGTLLLIVNVQVYFVDYANGAQGREALTVARIARAQPPGTRITLLGRPILFPNHGAIKFLAPDARITDLPNAGAFARAPGDGDVLVIAVPNHLDDLRAIQARYGGGATQEYYDPLGRLFLVTYQLAK